MSWTHENIQIWKLRKDRGKTKNKESRTLILSPPPNRRVPRCNISTGEEGWAPWRLVQDGDTEGLQGDLGSLGGHGGYPVALAVLPTDIWQKKLLGKTIMSHSGGAGSGGRSEGAGSGGCLGGAGTWGQSGGTDIGDTGPGGKGTWADLWGAGTGGRSGSTTLGGTLEAWHLGHSGSMTLGGTLEVRRLGGALEADAGALEALSRSGSRGHCRGAGSGGAL